MLAKADGNHLGKSALVGAAKFRVGLDLVEEGNPMELIGIKAFHPPENRSRRFLCWRGSVCRYSVS